MPNIEKIKEDLSTKYVGEILKYEEIWALPKNDEIRALVCSFGPTWAIQFALSVDMGQPTKETRTGSCKDPVCAYNYAWRIDMRPTEETREAAFKDLKWAKQYKEFEERYNVEHRKD
jgi:hypothetical protein